MNGSQMINDKIDELPIRRYLLGEASVEEGQKVEERLLRDADFFERLSLVEDELIDDFVRGELSHHERERFSEFFLFTPERRLKLEILQSLKSYAAAEVIHAQPVNPVRHNISWWESLTASSWLSSRAAGFALAVLLLVILGITWLVFRPGQTRNEPLEARVPDEVQRSPATPDAQPTPSTAPGGNSNIGPERRDDNSQPRNENASLPPIQTPTPARPGDTSPARSPVYAITLSAPLVRDGQQGKSFNIPLGTKQVRLSALFESESYEKYRAVVRNINTGEQVTREDLAAGTSGRSKRVAFTLPVKSLKPGDYIMLLSGTTIGGEAEDIRSYYFRISAP